MKPSTIAIDGPAASGKSTIGFHLAEQLNYLFLDTGVLYRAATWAVQAHGLDVDDEASVTQRAQEVDIQVLPISVDDGRQYTVHVDGQDVTWELRSSRVEGAVSIVSAYAGVRDALTRRMREIAGRGRVVMVGRDIGTVVIPDADLKLYVVASAEARAERRHQEIRTKCRQSGCDDTVTYEEVLAGIRERDRIDSQRETAPLRPASDAILFDTTELSIEAMFDEVVRLVNACDTQGDET
ncbi:MAG TPA: (d)CMP kinase [Candidatus Acetothermia bacterium]|nr:(d)CMP kinase [Candidatus Acetothermia bacterium]